MDLFNVTPSTVSTSVLSVPTYVDASTGMTTNEVKHGLDGTQGQSNATAPIAVQILNIESRLSDELNRLLFSPPVAYVYNPLNYAWETHSLFVSKFGNTKKQILFVGMNPGPWGMVQTGVIMFSHYNSIFVHHIMKFALIFQTESNFSFIQDLYMLYCFWPRISNYVISVFCV